MTPTLRDLRRFPVKSTGGEGLLRAGVDARGLVGDRGWAIYDADGKMASGKNTLRFRRMDAVFDLSSRIVPGASGPEIRIGSGEWIAAGLPGADEAASRHIGRPVRLKAERDTIHFDGGQVSLLGSASLEALGALLGQNPVDPRHFRTNLVLDTSDAWVEETWIGQTLRIGGVVLRVTERIERCRTIDLAQDGAAASPRLVKAVGEGRDMCVGVYADVIESGTLTVGDEVVVGGYQVPGL